MKRWSGQTVQYMVQYMAGFLAGALLFGGTAALATAPSVTDSTAKVRLNGREVTLQAYNIDGSNYFKLRDVAEAMDFGLWWQADSGTIHIESALRYDPDYRPDDPGTDQQPGYGRRNPAPVGVEQLCVINNVSEQYSVTMKLDSAVRGEEAWALLQKANAYNEAPPEGKEYVLATFTARVEKAAGDRAVNFSQAKLIPFSGDGVEYKVETVVTPDPKFRGDVYEGGTLTGTVAFLVDVADPAPKVAFGRNYDGTGGIWFDLTTK